LIRRETTRDDFVAKEQAQFLDEFKKKSMRS
jgi:hypothetical protein